MSGEKSQEWWSRLELFSLLRHAQFSANTRKGELLAVALARLYWLDFSDRTRELVEAIELRADDDSLPDINGEEFLDRFNADIRQMVPRIDSELELLILFFCGEWRHISDAARDNDSPNNPFGVWELLVREVYPNPFRPIAFSPSWRTDTALALARQMYDSRDFGAMPILADALQDAGCEDPVILDHCRDPKQVHVRGCWVVDLVLGKE